MVCKGRFRSSWLVGYDLHTLAGVCGGRFRPLVFSFTDSRSNQHVPDMFFEVVGHGVMVAHILP